MSTREIDLLIVGGGPAGLSAAINGASEGLDVLLLDNGAQLGGQARESSAIENYPGFPDGITGDGLMSRLVRQADKFHTGMLCPNEAAALARDGERILVTTNDYQEIAARAVLLSLGLQYRRLNARNAAQFMGRGIFYGVPNGKAPMKGRQFAVIGGANSAGQAVLNLARDPKAEVKLFIRKTIEAQMSTYLIDRIRATPNIEVCEGCEVVEAFGDTCLRRVMVRREGSTDEAHEVSNLFIFIGAMPRTLWLRGTIALDAQNFVLDGCEGHLPYETSMPGVFVAGDVRSGSTKRIAAAIGEGATALQMIHRRLG